MAEESNGGRSPSARASAASTRPSASPSDTISAGSGRVAASTRSRASAIEIRSGMHPIFPSPHVARFSAASAASGSGGADIVAVLLTEAPPRDGDFRVSGTRSGMDAPVTRLDETRGELAKTWLLRVVEQSSLEEIERLPTPRIARDLPDLIGEIARAASGDAPAGAARGVEWAKRLAELSGRGGTIDAQLIRDVAGLQSV